jgi:hypothetical protein
LNLNGFHGDGRAIFLNHSDVLEHDVEEAAGAIDFVGVDDFPGMDANLKR